MKRFLLFIKKETTIVFMLITVILLLSILPDIMKWKNTPEGRVYNPIHNCAQDYVLYLSYEKQGLDGQSTLYNLFTSEPHPGALANPFYLFLGRLWRTSHISDLHVVYHTTRILLAIVWALLLYWYIRRTLPSKTGRLIALFFVLYGTSFPIYHYPGSLFSVTTYMSWWSELNPTVRAAFLPAHLMGHILMLLMIALFTEKKLTLFGVVMGTLAGFCAGLFHTPSLLLPLALLPLWSLFTKQWKRLGIVMICLPISAISFFILSGQFSVFPWTMGWEYERQSFALSLPEYLLALGPIVPLGILGFFIAWKHKQGVVWIIWTCLCILGVGCIATLIQLPVPLISSLPVNNIRFLQMALPVPLSLLSSVTLLFIRKQFGKWVFFTLCIIIVFLTVVSFPASLVTQIRYMHNGPSFQYPTKGWMDAVLSLEKGRKDTVVLSLPFAGTAIAGYVNRTVYIGRAGSTINFSPKTDLAWSVYKGSMPVCETFDFLTHNRIDEVFIGYDEKTVGGDLTRYPFLRLSRDYGDTQIFSFTEKKPMECP